MADRVDAATVAVRTDDWPAQATDTIVRTVEKVRDRTTGPAITVARGVVYGLLAAVLGTAALILLVAAVIHGLDELVPRGVWVVYAILGTLFTVFGLVAWRKGKRPPE